MLIWDDRKRPAAPESQPKKMDYSHCPLKKRPVNYDFVKYEYVKQEKTDYGKYADFLFFPRDYRLIPVYITAYYKPRLRA